ncbi:DUF6171 family protein [Vallitalea guaymasensis]|uniref:DUF6171 family protein n=1 Tax=Vallitalea guaymasensis TaxID=1185412 RepID=UPI003A7F10F6
MKYICKRCMVFQEDEAELLPKIQSYIDTLDNSIRVHETIYQERLQHCENCSDLINGICKHCGCFVLVRAIKRKLHCPHPKLPKW